MTDVATQADILKFRKPPMTNAERQQRWRDRQKAKAAATTQRSEPVTQRPAPSPAARPARVIDVTSVTKRPFELTPWVLRGASIALAAVGLSMNAVYARSLGSNDLSGWLFLALGVTADASALVLPSVAAGLWKRGERGSAMAGWLVWSTVFAFALLSAVGFASSSISDVTSLRSSRVTPAVTAAQSALADAMTSRDRECRGGVGRFCREREAAVQASRQNLELAMHAVEAGADPQAQALAHLVSWVSHGVIAPSEGDVGMVRLILFALLPQIGGVLLMLGRRA